MGVLVRVQSGAPPQMKKIVFLILAIPVLSLFFSCHRQPAVENIDSKGKNIICFGNSLTSGVGARADNNFPDILRKRLPVAVINAGKPGDTSKDALLRLRKDVLLKDPFLVIVEFGGNDFLQRIKVDTTISNIEEIVRRIQQQGAMVVLCEVSAGYWGDSYRRGFRRIARKHRCLLIENILGGIINDPDKMYDYIHPNSEGYAVMAEEILGVVKPLVQKNLSLKGKGD